MKFKKIEDMRKGYNFFAFHGKHFKMILTVEKLWEKTQSSAEEGTL